MGGLAKTKIKITNKNGIESGHNDTIKTKKSCKVKKKTKEKKKKGKSSVRIAPSKTYPLWWKSWRWSILPELSEREMNGSMGERILSSKEQEKKKNVEKERNDIKVHAGLR